MADRKYESELLEEGYKLIAGTDEAGRGPLAGPLVVAAVILPNDYSNNEINDSKQLSAKKRERLFDEIINSALYYSIEIISSEEIDKSNIYKCSQRGMEKCIENIGTNCDCVISDAMPLPNLKQKVLNLIHGDALSISVAAASIIAKVTRDRIMDELDLKYPQYDFKNNKGYGTKKHIDAIKNYGITPIHRKTYNPVKDMINKQLRFEI